MVDLEKSNKDLENLKGEKEVLKQELLEAKIKIDEWTDAYKAIDKKITETDEKIRHQENVIKFQKQQIGFKERVQQLMKSENINREQAEQKARVEMTAASSLNR